MVYPFLITDDLTLVKLRLLLYAYSGNQWHVWLTRVHCMDNVANYIIAPRHEKLNVLPLALEAQTLINKLEAPKVYQRSSKCMKTSKKSIFKDSVHFYKYTETNTVFIKLIFFRCFHAF